MSKKKAADLEKRENGLALTQSVIEELKMENESLRGSIETNRNYVRSLSEKILDHSAQLSYSAQMKKTLSESLLQEQSELRGRLMRIEQRLEVLGIDQTESSGSAFNIVRESC